MIIFTEKNKERVFLLEFSKIPVGKIIIPEGQPRQRFDEESLQQLADSMEEVGQLQPVIVKKAGEKYQLIAGERRLLATRKNNQKKIAAVIVDEEITDEYLRQIQLIENLQREDLDPLERAQSIQQFIDDNELTKKDASKKLGVPRTTLTEWLNILEVPEKYQYAVVDSDSPLSLSHISLARALVSRTGDPVKLKQLLDGVLKYNLSRSETKAVTEIFHKYLHLPMEEAIGAILLRRERYLPAENDQAETEKKYPVRNLIHSFKSIGENLEGVMEKVGVLDDEEKEILTDEFLYIFQLVAVMVPEFRKRDIREMIDEIKQKNMKGHLE